MNKLIRKFEFDAGHRVMNHTSKCFYYHGHRYYGELSIEYKSEAEIGYAIDFAEVKRVFCSWVDDYLDHGFIANEKDVDIIELCRKEKTKLFIMPGSDINPSAENIAKVLFYVAKILLDSENLKVCEVLLYETPNCSVACASIDSENMFYQSMPRAAELFADVLAFKQEKGKLEYDRRNVKSV